MTNDHPALAPLLVRRRGRPPRDDSRCCTVTARLSEDNLVRVTREAAHRGMSRSEWIQETLLERLHGLPAPALTDEEVRAVRVASGTSMRHQDLPDWLADVIRAALKKLTPDP